MHGALTGVAVCFQHVASEAVAVAADMEAAPPPFTSVLMQALLMLLPPPKIAAVVGCRPAAPHTALGGSGLGGGRAGGVGEGNSGLYGAGEGGASEGGAGEGGLGLGGAGEGSSDGGAGLGGAGLGGTGLGGSGAGGRGERGGYPSRRTESYTCCSHAQYGKGDQAHLARGLFMNRSYTAAAPARTPAICATAFAITPFPTFQSPTNCKSRVTRACKPYPVTNPRCDPCLPCRRWVPRAG